MAVTKEQIQAAIERKSAGTSQASGVTRSQIDAAIERKTQQLPEVQGRLNASLIDQLSGSLPSQGDLPPRMIRRTGRGDLFSLKNPAFQRETTRRDAFQQLTDKGFDAEQINTVLDINKRLKPGIIQSIKQDIGQSAGGAAGGAIGALIAGQLGPQAFLPEEIITVPLAATVGAFLGGGAGKSIQQAIDPLESPSARDFLKAGVTEAAFEGGGRALKPIARGLGFGKKSSEAVKEAKARFGLAEGFFSPAQRDPRIAIRASEQLSRGSFGGGPVFAAHNIAQQGQALQIGQDIIKKVTGEALEDPAVLGDEIAGIFTRLGEKGQQVRGVRQTLLDTFFDDIYKQVDALSPGAEFTTAPLKKLAKETLEKDIKQGGALLTSEGRSRLQGIGKTLTNTKSADEMRQLRSLYAKDARRFQIGGDQSSVIFSELAEAADGILFDEGSQAGLTEPAKKLLRNANAVYGPSKQLYNEEVVKEIVRKLNTKPGLVNTLIGQSPDPKKLKTLRELLISPIRKVSGSGSSTKTVTKELRAARRSLKNPHAVELISKNINDGKRLWKQLRGSWLRENIINPQTGLLDAKRMDKLLKGMDKNSFKIMFPGETGKNLKALNGLVDVISPEKEGLATLFGKGIEFSGAGAIGSGISAGSGARITKGGLLTIGPTMYAKIATNPKATKILTLGLKQQAKGGTVNVAALTARIINALNDQDAAERKAIGQERKRLLSAPAKKRRQQAIGLGARDE